MADRKTDKSKSTNTSSSTSTSTTTTTVPGGTEEDKVKKALEDAGITVQDGPYDLPDDFKYPRRYVTMRGEGNNYVFQGGKWYYTGSDLVDNKGNISRKAYDPVNEAFPTIAGMPLDKRQSFLSELKRRGFYGQSKPSATGFDSQDISAMAQFLVYANTVGKEKESALVQASLDFRSAAGGTALRLAAKEDLRAVASSVFHQQLGRRASRDEMDRFIKAFRSVEQRGSEGGEQAPSAQTVAEQTVTERYGEEEQAYGFAQLGSMFESILRGA